MRAIAAAQEIFASLDFGCSPTPIETIQVFG
jgi:hypothetical protein